MSLYVGQRWEFHNVTTDEVREYEVETIDEHTSAGALCYLRRVDRGEGVSFWRPVGVTEAA